MGKLLIYFPRGRGGGEPAPPNRAGTPNTHTASATGGGGMGEGRDTFLHFHTLSIPIAFFYISFHAPSYISTYLHFPRFLQTKNIILIIFYITSNLIPSYVSHLPPLHSLISIFHFSFLFQPNPTQFTHHTLGTHFSHRAGTSNTNVTGVARGGGWRVEGTHPYLYTFSPSLSFFTSHSINLCTFSQSTFSTLLTNSL